MKSLLIAIHYLEGEEGTMFDINHAIYCNTLKYQLKLIFFRSMLQGETFGIG